MYYGVLIVKKTYKCSRNQFQEELPKFLDHSIITGGGLCVLLCLGRSAAPADHTHNPHGFIKNRNMALNKSLIFSKRFLFLLKKCSLKHHLIPIHLFTLGRPKVR